MNCELGRNVFKITTAQLNRSHLKWPGWLRTFTLNFLHPCLLSEASALVRLGAAQDLRLACLLKTTPLSSEEIKCISHLKAKVIKGCVCSTFLVHWPHFSFRFQTFHQPSHQRNLHTSADGRNSTVASASRDTCRGKKIKFPSKPLSVTKMPILAASFLENSLVFSRSKALSDEKRKICIFFFFLKGNLEVLRLGFWKWGDYVHK